jgi:hypothetical protein
MVPQLARALGLAIWLWATLLATSSSAQTPSSGSGLSIGPGLTRFEGRKPPRSGGG